ncbi:MAG: hypothetical protein RL641_334 [Candidatus Parcubacteria bacterium]|jgi:hypothetical protein
MAPSPEQINNSVEVRARGGDFDVNTETKEEILTETEEEKFVEELARAIVFIAKATI